MLLRTRKSRNQIPRPGRDGMATSTRSRWSKPWNGGRRFRECAHRQGLGEMSHEGGLDAAEIRRREHAAAVEAVGQRVRFGGRLRETRLQLLLGPRHRVSSRKSLARETATSYSLRTGRSLRGTRQTELGGDPLFHAAIVRPCTPTFAAPDAAPWPRSSRRIDLRSGRGRTESGAGRRRPGRRQRLFGACQLSPRHGAGLHQFA